jgi:hypothetical protein
MKQEQKVLKKERRNVRKRRRDKTELGGDGGGKVKDKNN